MAPQRYNYFRRVQVPLHTLPPEGVAETEKECIFVDTFGGPTSQIAGHAQRRKTNNNLNQKVLKRGNIWLLLALWVSFIATLNLCVAQGSEAATTTPQSSLFEENGHDRPYIEERHTHAALLSEVHTVATPSTVRTNIGRQRTHQSSCQLLTAAHKVAPSGQPTRFVSPQSSPQHTARAVDYYIFALRHIII